MLFIRSVVSASLRPHGLQHARLLCPSPSPRFAQTHVRWVSDSVSVMPVTQWHWITDCIKFDRHITINFQTILCATNIFLLLPLSLYNIVQWLTFLSLLDPSLHQLENCYSVIFKKYNAGDSFWALHSWQCLFFLCLAIYFCCILAYCHIFPQNSIALTPFIPES